MSTPATNIYICSGVPLNNRYDHTLYFANANSQLTYFSGKVVRTLKDYSYVRKSWKLKVAATMEEARVWSYLYFQNGTTGKRYFYFINQIEYINENSVELTLEIDVIQTYMFDWVLRPCYVEREHSVTDNWGENTIDEGLETGDLITASKETVDLSSELVIMVAASIDINKYYVNGVEDQIVASKYDKIFGGFQVTAVGLNAMSEWDDMAWDELAKILYKLQVDGKLDAIFTIWQYPGNLLSWTDGDYETALAKYVTGSSTFTYTASARPTTINGYKPKNQKVLQYPYCMLYATNNSGGAAVYQYEKFSSNNYTFRIRGNIAPDAVIKLIPVSYKGVAHNYDEALSMGNYPICSWNSDTYKLWLAQNQNQQNLGFAMSGLKIIGGVGAIVGGVAAAAPTGGTATVAGVSAGVGLISSGASGIASQLAQRADKDIQPPQARGTYSGSHNLSNGLQNFDFYHKTIDAYHAEMIDNYFSMYGYATRKVKTPNISSRPAWNYVKTIGSNIGGNMCMEDLKLINAIFDKGITFWKNTDVGNYALDNTP